MLKSIVGIIGIIMLISNVNSSRIFRKVPKRKMLAKSNMLNNDVLDCFYDFWNLKNTMYLTVAEIDNCGASINEYEWWTKSYRPRKMPKFYTGDSEQVVKRK